MTRELAHPPTPCNDCPFRREGGIRLRAGRLEEIVAAVAPPDGQGASFQCHKTRKKNAKYLVCAGALIFAYKQDATSQYTRVLERLRAIDPDLAKGDHPEIFDDIAEMLETAV